MAPPLLKPLRALGLIALGAAFGAAGIYVGQTDDAPGAALLGFMFMISFVVIAIRDLVRKT